MDKNNIKNTFKEYVKKFDETDPAIKMKIDHSYRVMEIATDIAKNVTSSKDDIEISTIAGLLHDYARFQQWTQYKTYSDLASIDHADLAVDLLFDEEIKRYTEKKQYYNKIYDAIKYHNKLEIPNNINKDNRLICEIIRDADKLDIFYINSNRTLIIGDDDIVTPKVKKDFLSKKLIDRRNMKNSVDNILLLLSMVFDLNFKYSYKYLLETKIIDKMYEKITNKNKIEEYFKILKECIEERAN